MKKGILIVLIVAAFSWAVYEFVSSSDDHSVEENQGNSTGAGSDGESNDDVETSEEVGLSKGNMAPDFELETIDGESVKLSDYRGQKVIVNFWATWCPPCRAEIPDLQKVYDNTDVEILAVNLTDTESDEGKVKPFVDDFEMTFPVLMDQESDVATTYEVAAYPTSYMIDSDGHIQFVAMGAMNYEIMMENLEKFD
ncbi:MAG TPA: TlpA disulfide reductase family protein [Virgibacillus sp.]|nr:TlpA disulfide reductase family protein [Virgibacillus sp.]